MSTNSNEPGGNSSSSPPPLPALETSPFTFTLGTLMLAVTLVAVLCGLSVTAPGLGIPLAIVSVPTWIRASRALAVDPRTSENSTLGDKLEQFITSLWVVIMICMASCIAGLAACAAVGLVGGEGWLNNYIGTGLAYLFIAVVLFGTFVHLSLEFWPTRERPEQNRKPPT